MADYVYQMANGYNSDKLHAEVAASGLPGFEGVLGDAGGVVLRFAADLTAAQKTTLDGVVAAHDPRPRRKRTIHAIYTDIGALTSAKQTAVWNDLNAGSPPKWALDAGPNAAAIVAIHWSAANSGATAANVNDARRRLAAAYVQDNVTYLLNPAFDPTISIPGEEPYTP